MALDLVLEVLNQTAIVYEAQKNFKSIDTENSNLMLKLALETSGTKSIAPIKVIE